MDCNKFKSQINEYIYGELSEKDSHEVEGHINSCGDCHRHYEELKSVLSGYRAVGRPAPPEDAVAEALKKASQLPQVKRVTVGNGSGSFKSVAVWFKNPAFAVAASVVIVGIVLLGTRNDGEQAEGIVKKGERHVSMGQLTLDEEKEGPVLPSVPVKKRNDGTVSSGEIDELLQKASAIKKKTRAKEILPKEINKEKNATASIDNKDVDAKSGWSSALAENTTKKDVATASPSVKEKPETVATMLKKEGKKFEVVEDKAEDLAAAKKKTVEEKAKLLKAGEQKAVTGDLALGSNNAKRGEIDPELDAEFQAEPVLKKRAKVNDSFESLTPQQSLKKAYDLYMATKYREALDELRLIPDGVGNVKVAALELEAKSYYALHMEDQMHQTLDLLTRIAPEVGARVAREISEAKKKARELQEKKDAEKEGGKEGNEENPKEGEEKKEVEEPAVG